MELRLLGTTEALNNAAAATLGGPLQRAVLADLALHASHTISLEGMIDDLWDVSQPASATHTLRTYVSRLRRGLATIGCADALATSGPGYRLDVATSDVDALLFIELLGEGRRALGDGEVGTAADVLRRALSLWHGPALADVRQAAFAEPAAVRLESSRLDATEALLDARLQLGEHLEVVTELERLVAAEPLRERLHAQLMLALYRSGRQADALAAFQAARKLLVEQVGVEPGRELRELEQAVLCQAPELEAPVVQARLRAARPPPTAAPAGMQHLADAEEVGTMPSKAHGLKSRWRLVTVRRHGFVAAVAVAVAAVACCVPLLDAASVAPAMPAVGLAELAGASGKAIEALPLPSLPGAAAAGDGSVWVTSPESGLLYRIDPSSAAVEATIEVGDGAGALAVDGPDVWVANTLSGTLARVSAATDTVVETVGVGSEPTGLAIGDGAVWAADSAGSSLSELDPATGQVSSDPLGAPPFGLALGDGAVWVSEPGSDEVTRLTAGGGPPVEVSVGSGPTAIVVGFGSVWVANGLDSTVSRIDPATDSVVATIAVGDGPDALTVAGGSLWVANRESSTLSRIDPLTDGVTATVPVAGDPAALAAWAGGVWIATGGSIGRKAGGTLRVVSSVAMPSIDPALSYPWEGPLFLEGTYDTLVTFEHVGGDAGLQLVPDLALAMPTISAGGTQYSFVLRRGLRYSDGRSVRPEDFRRAIERVFELNSNASVFFDGILGAAACSAGHACDLDRGIMVSASTDEVTFRLSAPDPAFLDKLAFQFTAPVPARFADSGVGVRSPPIPSTGPYEISTYLPGKEVVFSRNPYFHEWSAAAEPAGSPDRIVWTFGESVPKEVAEIESGRADWTWDMVPDVASLASQFPAQVHVNPAFAIDYVAFNVRVAPFDDERVRQAFSLAADRNQLVAELGGPDVAAPTCQFLPPGMPGYVRYCPFTADPSPGGTWVGPQLAAARRLVAESGTDGMKVVFWNLRGEETTTSFAVSVLRSLGYRVSVVSPPFSVFLANVNDSRRRVQLSDGEWSADYPNASDLFDVLFRCSAWKLADPSAVRNGSFFCAPGVDALMNEADDDEEPEPATAASVWAAVDRGVTDDAPWVPLVSLTSVDFLSARVSHYEYNPAWGVLLDQLVIGR